MKELSCLIPFLNEEEILEENLKSHYSSLLKAGVDFEIVLIDSGSKDSSLGIAKEFSRKHNKVRVVEGDLQSPSIARAFSLGIGNSSGEFLLLLPLDVSMANTDLKEIDFSKKSGGYWVFQKEYNSRSTYLNFYAKIQNSFRTKFLKSFVWTNGLIISRETLKSIEWPDYRFLDDVILSDRLRKVAKINVLNSRLIVDSRKYYSKGVVKQSFINVSIVFLFRTGLFNPKLLKRIY